MRYTALRCFGRIEEQVSCYEHHIVNNDTESALPWRGWRDKQPR